MEIALAIVTAVLIVAAVILLGIAWMMGAIVGARIPDRRGFREIRARFFGLRPRCIRKALCRRRRRWHPGSAGDLNLTGPLDTAAADAEMGRPPSGCYADDASARRSEITATSTVMPR
jgi:hypothetical protein